MKRLFFLLSLVLAASCAGPRVPFEPAQATVVSDEADLMAHCSAFLVAGDTVYFSYYHDVQQTLETPTATSIADVFAKADWPRMENISRVEVMRAGQQTGDFRQASWRAPYDPNMLRIGDGIFYYFIGCVDSTVTYCVRRYDIPSARFADEVQSCMLHYKGKSVEMNTPNVQQMFEDYGFPAVFNNDVNMSAPFVKYEGEYYSSMGNAFLKRSCPVVVKTRNGVDFEVVMLCPEFTHGCCESSVAIWHDEFYVIMRNSQADRGVRGVYLAKYSADGRCLAGPVYLSEAQSKPCLVLDHGRLLAIYNANPWLETDWGLVSRSRLRISEIGRDCSVLRSWDITSPYGIHYPYAAVVNGDVWMTFTEDRKQVDPAQTRSNISFVKLWK